MAMNGGLNAPPPVSAIIVIALMSAMVHACLQRIPAHVVLWCARRCGARRADGFDVRMWLHSAFVGVGALVAVALEWQLDVREPARSFACMPPSSTLAYVLPAMEMGYALHDLRDALRLGRVPFVLHGLLVAGMLATMFVLQVAHHVTVALTLHLSSVFLNLRRVDFGPAANMAIDITFAVSFIVLRLVWFPALWLQFIWQAGSTERASWGACMLGGYAVLLAAASGLVLHGLNAYWGWQIVQKLISRHAWRDVDGVGRLAQEGHFHGSKVS